MGFEDFEVVKQVDFYEVFNITVGKVVCTACKGIKVVVEITKKGKGEVSALFEPYYTIVVLISEI